jgi:hypothetical protein
LTPPRSQIVSLWEECFQLVTEIYIYQSWDLLKTLIYRDNYTLVYSYCGNEPDSN